MTSGIYMIKANGRCYIGQSKSIERRFYSHMWSLRKGNHGNHYLQNIYNKYGEEVFEFKILIKCPEENLNKWEQSFIDENYDQIINIEMSVTRSVMSEEHKNNLARSRGVKLSSIHTFFNESTGEEVTCYPFELVRGNNLDRSSLWKVINGDRISHKGWKIAV